MRTYLVVAHRTLVEDHLLDHVRSLCAGGDCVFHLVVPVHHPRDHAWTDGEVEAAAKRRLAEGLAAFESVGAEVTGEVGDANPVYAVTSALRGRPDTDWAGVIVSTLPRGIVPLARARCREPHPVRGRPARDPPRRRQGRRGHVRRGGPPGRFPAWRETAARGCAGRLGGRMALLDRFLRVGEGKKVRALQSLVPDIGALEPEMEALSDDALAGQDRRVPPAPRQRRGPRRPAHRGLRRRARGRRRGARPAPLRRAADGRRRPALRLGRRDEDRRGQDPRLDPAGLPQRPDRRGHAPHHGQRLPGHPRRRVDGPAPPLARPDRRPRSSPADHDPAHKRAQYACDITYGTNNEFGFDYLRDNMAPSRAGQVQRGHAYAIVDEVDSILIDEARTPLIISGRVADAAQALLPVRLDRPRACSATSTTRSTRRSAPSPPPRTASRRSSARSASRTSTTASPRTSSTSSRRPSRPRSCSSATRTTSSPTAR